MPHDAAFSSVTSKPIVLPFDNIDTDQIIPARFLTTTSREGLGAFAFADWRYADDGTPKPDSRFDGPQAEGRRILVAGPNFGCGSSREHAPWALRDLGIQAVLSVKIADIFRNNALKNGVVAVEAPKAVVAHAFAHPDDELTVDLEACEIRTSSGISAAFVIDGFARHRLLNGVDELGFLLSHDAEIAAFESAHDAP